MTRHASEVEETKAPARGLLKSTVTQLVQEEKKLLRAHYDDLISEDLFAEELARIQGERADADREWTLLEIDHREMLENLDLALSLTDEIQTAYAQVNPAIRRLFN